jgi:DNA-binding transcriptional LysR family regulator
LDRAGYRVELTEMGRSFHRRARAFLQELDGLCVHAAQLAMGEESELRVVIGDLCPLPETLGLLRRFFDACPGTRLHLHFEALSGPWERLFDNEADLILHHINKAISVSRYRSLYGAADTGGGTGLSAVSSRRFDHTWTNAQPRAHFENCARHSGRETTS